MQSMQHIWDRIEFWLKTQQASTVLNNLQPGAIPEDIQNAENILGMVLPEDLKASYRIHNGSNGCAFMDMWSLHSLESIVEDWKMFHQNAEGDLWEQWVDNPEGEFRATFWCPGWIPFLHNGAGGYGFIDLVPLSNGQVGQILARYHGDTPDLLATSFQTYMSMFADDLEAGEYVLDEFGTPTSEGSL